MIMWTYTLCAAGSIFVVFSRGYLDLEESPVVWILAMLASIMLPLVAVLPLISVTKAIRRARAAYLLQLERISKGRGLVGSGEQAEEFNRLLGLAGTIRQGNILPFRAQAVIFFTLINVLQVTLAAGELLR